MKLRHAVLIGVLGAVVAALFVMRNTDPLRLQFCTANAKTYDAKVDLEQARWAARMSAIAAQRGMPVRATTIAIATAFQESKIHNIDYGDRDSVGLFQQRPSQGWGTREQILDPTYSIGKFYDGLAKVDGYESMEITVAAQRVQRSAFPNAYGFHEDDARAMSSTLRGYSPRKFSCQIAEPEVGSAADVAADVEQQFGLSPRHEEKFTVSFRVDSAHEQGWALAHYLVANANWLRIHRVDHAGSTWTAEDSPDGWVDSDAEPGVVTVSVS